MLACFLKENEKFSLKLPEDRPPPETPATSRPIAATRARSRTGECDHLAVKARGCKTFCGPAAVAGRTSPTRPGARQVVELQFYFFPLEFTQMGDTLKLPTQQNVFIPAEPYTSQVPGYQYRGCRNGRTCQSHQR